MPIAAWLHPLTGRVHALGDERELAQVVPVAFLHALLRHEADDKRHSGANLTVTAALGCPRRTFIERALDYVCNPQRMVSVTLGTALHEHFAAWMIQEGTLAATGDGAVEFKREWHVEGIDDAAVEFKGTILGHELTGKPDTWRDNGRELTDLWDWKSSMSGSHKFVQDGQQCEDHHTVQLNFNRMLIGQQTGLDVRHTNMVAWIASGQWRRTWAPVWGEGECAAVRPGKGDYTVESILGQLAGAFAKWQAGGDARVIAASLPLVGEKQWRTKKGDGCSCTNLCACEYTCKELAGGGLL